MKAHAAAIAEKLQGAHERRTGRGREDEDMGKDESVWTTQIDQVVSLLQELKTAAPGEPQSNAVSAERVVELERTVAHLQSERERDAQAFQRKYEEMDNERAAALAKAEGVPLAHQADAAQEIDELQREVDTLRTGLAKASEQRDERERWLQDASNLLRDAYVVREVPWSDVAAGMMTIARDGTPWMVAEESAGVFQLQNGTRAFAKNPAEDETVRVLVPYVTPEQAETAVREQLGGTAVS